MLISEVYKSLQGEGLLTGTESVFLRTCGCNLRCVFCDTRYTSWEPEGEDIAIADLVSQVTRLECSHVVITGGEPFLFAELIPLCEMLKQQGAHITIETAGTLFLPVACDLVSLSPKLANSDPRTGLSLAWQARHRQSRHRPEVIRQLLKLAPYQIKFVVGSPADCDEAEAYLIEFPEIDRTRAMLMPEGVSAERLREVAAWLEPYCQANGWHYCARRHIEWYGHRRGV